jgi:SAM-dependent methyltransferase
MSWPKDAPLREQSIRPFQVFVPRLSLGADMSKTSDNGLTDSQFWEEYWKNIKLPCTVDQRFSFDRCLSRTLLQRIAELSAAEENPGAATRKSVLEVGAAPGKWLSMFPTDRFSVSGIEYSDAGMAALRKNLEMLSIEPGRLIHGDFFKVAPEPVYDIVMSLGFIEHFDDPVTVVERHLGWLRRGGLLIIGVPNFAGVHGFIQRHLDTGILQAHNTSIMNKEWFASLGQRLGIRTHSIEYLGSFEPALPLTYRRLGLGNFILKALLRLATYVRRWDYFDDFNSPAVSSYILGAYRKTG